MARAYGRRAIKSSSTCCEKSKRFAVVSVEVVIDAWNRFFHEPNSPITIGVFRVLWGLLMMFNALLLWRRATLYFGPRGLLPTDRYHIGFGRGRLTLFHLLPDTNGSVHLVFFLHVAAVGLMTIGLATRVSTLMTWLTLISIHHRNPMLFNSGDSLVRLLTFLLIFSRAGQACSLDALIATDGKSFLGTGSLSSPWCERLMQIQVAIVYLRTVLWKLRGKPWRDGTAAYYPLQLRSYIRVPMPKVMQMPWCIRLATWGTLVIETAIALLIWFKELRYPVLILGITLHLMLDLLINVQLFGWIMMVSLVLFIPPEHMEWLLTWQKNATVLSTLWTESPWCMRLGKWEA